MRVRKIDAAPATARRGSFADTAPDVVRYGGERTRHRIATDCRTKGCTDCGARKPAWFKKGFIWVTSRWDVLSVPSGLAWTAKEGATYARCHPEWNHAELRVHLGAGNPPPWVPSFFPQDTIGTMVTIAKKAGNPPFGVLQEDAGGMGAEHDCQRWRTLITHQGKHGNTNKAYGYATNPRPPASREGSIGCHPRGIAFLGSPIGLGRTEKAVWCYPALNHAWAPILWRASRARELGKWRTHFRRLA